MKHWDKKAKKPFTTKSEETIRKRKLKPLPKEKYKGWELEDEDLEEKSKAGLEEEE